MPSTGRFRASHIPCAFSPNSWWVVSEFLVRCLRIPSALSPNSACVVSEFRNIK